MRGGKDILEDIAFMIEATDSYRVGRNIDFKKVESVMERLSPELPDIFNSATKKKYKKTVDFITSLPFRNRSMRKFAILYMLFRFLLRVSLVGFLLSIGLIFYAPPYSTPTLIASTSSLYAALVGRWYTLMKLLEFYEREMRNQPGKDELLKEIAQKLIDELSSKIGERGVKPGKYKLHLFRDDYSGVRILKRPGWLRDYYLAEVEIGGILNNT
jgi:uncharacterized membrane protein